MKRPLYFLLALFLPLALTGCARTDTMTATGAGPGGMSSDMLAGTSASMTITENALAVAELSTLVQALQAADLADVLSGPGPYTVFAPTNAAFDLIDADDMLASEMDDDAKAQLAELLKSHVVEGTLMFDDLNNGETVVALTGADYGITFDGGNMLEKQINQADIIAYDIKSSNGVIHVINLVLDDEGFFSQ